VILQNEISSTHATYDIHIRQFFIDRLLDYNKQKRFRLTQVEALFRFDSISTRRKRFQFCFLFLFFVFISTTMGSAASLQHLTAEQVGDLVGGLGSAYSEYKVQIVANGCDGKFLMDIKDENEFDELLEEMKVKNKIHLKKIRGLFLELNLIKIDNADVAIPTTDDENNQTIHTEILLKKSPRQLITELNKIQGIPLDPQSMSAASDAIKNAIQSCISSLSPEALSDKEYDCFISYRVSSEADVAEKLYLNLKLSGLNPFLDKMCLKDGQDWKTGFLSGLHSSKCFLSLLSAKALKPATDCTRNHENDNYLLEIEHALENQRLSSGTNQPNQFIIPVHVGEYIELPPPTGLVLVKFKDFNPLLYAESITPSASTIPSSTDPSQSPQPLTADDILTSQSKTYLNGEIYDGQFKGIFKHGYGMLKYPDNSVYKGPFKDDQRDGKGTMIYANGDKYDGEWKNDVREGEGILKYGNGEIYKGEFLDDKLHGQGQMILEGGVCCFEGEYRDGQRYKGKSTLADGSMYDGEWKVDTFHGKGTLIDPNGDIYEGEFANGKRNGRGIQKYANGEILAGRWSEDYFVVGSREA
jgi:hypothetical protein